MFDDLDDLHEAELHEQRLSKLLAEMRERDKAKPVWKTEREALARKLLGELLVVLIRAGEIEHSWVEKKLKRMLTLPEDLKTFGVVFASKVPYPPIRERLKDMPINILFHCDDDSDYKDLPF